MVQSLSTLHVALMFTMMQSAVALEIKGLGWPTRSIKGRSGVVSFDGSLNTEAIKVDLFNTADSRFELIRSATAEKAEGTWIGTDQSQSTEATFVHSNGALTGSIVTPDAVYQIRTTDDGLTLVDETEAGQIKEESPCQVPPEELPGWTANHSEFTPMVTADEAAAPVINVMVFYTAESRTKVGYQGMKDLVKLAVTETNDIYNVSGSNVKIRLAGSTPLRAPKALSDAAYPDVLELLKALRNDPNVKRLRDQLKADLVTLISENGQACGVGYRPGRLPAPNAVFSVVSSGCATGYYSFGHELGHNMGFCHDRPTNPSCPGTDGYNVGYWPPSKKWRTMMSYSCAGGCGTRKKRLSTPNRKIGTEPTGTRFADNARALNEAGPIVAAYR